MTMSTSTQDVVFSRENTIEKLNKLADECKTLSTLYLNNHTIEEVVEKYGTAEQFIADFIMYLNHSGTYYTMDSNTYMSSCDPSRNRSLGDLYRLALYYFPDANIVSIAIKLTELAKNKEIAVCTCGDIHKSVFAQYSGSSINYSHLAEQLEREDHAINRPDYSNITWIYTEDNLDGYTFTDLNCLLEN